MNEVVRYKAISKSCGINTEIDVNESDDVQMEMIDFLSRTGLIEFTKTSVERISTGDLAHLISWAEYGMNRFDEWVKNIDSEGKDIFTKVDRTIINRIKGETK